MPDAPVSVADAIDNIHAWDGEIVTVYGWLGNCQGMDCGIYPTIGDAQVIARGNHESDAWDEAMDRRLSIGSSPAFDAKAIPLQHSYVRLKARINDDCWRAGCTDRADVLQPISVEAVTLHEKAE